MTNIEQNEPIQDGSLDASDEDKKLGILEQVAADMRGHPLDEVIEMLTQRLTESGIPENPVEVRKLAQSLSSVD